MPEHAEREVVDAILQRADQLFQRRTVAVDRAGGEKFQTLIHSDALTAHAGQTCRARSTERSTTSSSFKASTFA